MTGAALTATNGSPVEHRNPAIRLIHAFFRIVTAPLRAFQAVRHAMTPASVSLLLFSIVTLNIIWGFPWTGMFSACVGMFVAGCLIHFGTRPSLNTSFSLPNSSPAGQSFSVTIHARNQRVLPALDFTLSFAPPKPPRRNWFARHRSVEPPYSVRQTLIRNAVLRAGETAHLAASLQFTDRGIHPLPDILVRGSFPFHLFESTAVSLSDTTVAITPKALTADDTAAKGLLNNLGGWSHRLLSGDELDYTGSREYVAGMAVRRWDFPSWARLGTPIVREFQSPSIQKVFLIVDTALDEPFETGLKGTSGPLERMLSLAATAVHDLSRKSVQVELHVTGEALNNNSFPQTTPMGSDAESMLIRLAAAEPVPSETADIQLGTLLEIAGRSPLLVLTTRELVSLHSSNNKRATVIRVDDTDTPASDKKQDSSKHIGNQL